LQLCITEYNEGNEDEKKDFDELLKFFSEKKAVEIQENMTKMISGSGIKEDKPDLTKK
jgi:hypothetical protein